MLQTDQPLRLGTRASPLAMAQANSVREALIAAHGWNKDRIEIVPMVASGDRIQDRALADVGGKALWTKELDFALANREIDFAVHSMKDVETARPDAFTIAAILERADVRDRLIGIDTIAALPSGAVFGTSAPRRRAQILRMRPDLEIALLRGNVQTRLAKVQSGDVSATLLAAAGLDRLGLFDTGAAISIEELLPAPAQGAIGIETLVANGATKDLIAAINHFDTYSCVMTERALLRQLSGDCRSPIAALARIDGPSILLQAEIYSPDGAEMVCGQQRCTAGTHDGAIALANDLLARASPNIVATFGR